MLSEIYPSPHNRNFILFEVVYVITTIESLSDKEMLYHASYCVD